MLNRCLLTLLFFTLFKVPASAQVSSFAYVARDREQIYDTQLLQSPQLKGVQIMYLWRQLEPQKNSYDFSAIKADLKHLKAHGKTLFIQLQDATFHPKVIPVPVDMQSPSFGGGVSPQYNESGQHTGWVARRWDTAVQTRFQALLQALGREFDGRIAGINLQETAIEVTHPKRPTPPGFNPHRYRDSILENMGALKQSFPKSTVMQYANFMPGEWLPHHNKGYLESVYAFAEHKGIAIGTPDLLPQRKGQRNHAYKLMHQGNNVFGVAVQDGNYFNDTGDPVIPDNTPNLVPELYRYATDHLRVRYIFWVTQAPFFTRDVLPFLAHKATQEKQSHP